MGQPGPIIKRVILIVLDSVGIGSLPDAERFGDQGANTLLHVHQQAGGLVLPNLCALGIGALVEIDCPLAAIWGCYGKMAERSAGKDTTSGHWELAGLVHDDPFPVYPDGFPPEIMRVFEKEIERKTLGNYACSGTLILEELGADHLASGWPIVYTSADSVFQIAAHEKLVPLELLYEWCRAARRILTGAHSVGRVIARPFRGRPGAFRRLNEARKDFSIAPDGETLLDRLASAGLMTVGIGKIGDIFGHRGLAQSIATRNNQDGVNRTVAAMKSLPGHKGLIWVNLVDFDMLYGHRRDARGYAAALEEVDRRIPEILDALLADDLLIISADHGCDPSWRGHTDHTREYVPLLVYGRGIRSNVNLGVRSSLADCGQTIAELLGAGPLAFGQSFAHQLFP